MRWIKRMRLRRIERQYQRDCLRGKYGRLCQILASEKDKRHRVTIIYPNECFRIASTRGFQSDTDHGG